MAPDASGKPDPSLCPSLNVTVYMHNQGDLELLTLWIVGKGGKCHKKNHHFDCSLYSIHSIDMTDLTIESNENREKRFAYLVLLFGYFRIRHFFISFKATAAFICFT